EISADHIGIEDRRQPGAQQHRHLAERVLRVDLLVAQGRAGFVVDDIDARGQPGLVGEHQRLAGIGGIGSGRAVA
ncbi:hypothetical protein CATMIT_01728, partial [Catenibacterium mitsuokai DSM 15897]